MNKLFYALALLTTLFAVTSQAQPARKSCIGIFRYLGRHDSFFYDVYVTADSNYVATGRTEAGADPEPFWVVLSARNGEEIWSNTFPDDRGGYDDGDATSIIETDDGDFAVGGQMELNGELRYVVMKCNADGEQIWFNTYGGDTGLCLAVIETKAGNLLTCGTLGERGEEQAYAAMLDQDGEVIWDEIYADGVCFNAVREIADGYLFADYGPGTGLFKIDDHGEVVWQHRVDGNLLSLVSCPVDGGFAACGSRDRTALLVRFDVDGEEEWSRTYESPEGRYRGVANCLIQMPDGGFYMVGERPMIWSRYRTSSQIEIRVDAEGHVQWQRGSNGALVMGYLSVVRDVDGLNVIAGSIDMQQQPAGRDYVGILEKVYPQRSAPIITSYTPVDLQMQVMRLDTVIFSVEAMDYQEDEIYFEWLMDDSIRISVEDSVEVIFSELWDHTVSCVVSDEDDATRIDWSVYVIELFISGHDPENLDIATTRNTLTEFSIEVVAVEPDLVEYSWTIGDSIVGTEATLTLGFPLPTHYFLTAAATANDFTDRVCWDVEVQSVLSQWLPSQLELNIDQYATQQFCLVAFNLESDSLNYRWIHQGAEVCDADTVDIIFSEAGEFVITGFLSDGSATDSICWRVNVIPNSVPGESNGLPERCELVSVYPNPFNSTTTISFKLPTTEMVLMAVYDPSGREVARLVDGLMLAGLYEVVWECPSVGSGIYFIRLSNNADVSEQKKVVLFK